MSKFKLNKREKFWILYDVGNSAFTMLVSTLIPIYFNALASAEGVSSADYLAYWGYAGSIATLLTAIIGPVFGTLADRKNYKKPIFTIALILGVASCAVLGFAWSEERMDNVSSQGYAFGYIGSCIPFIACLVIVLMSDKLGLTQSAAMTIAFIITAAWWLVLTIPLLKTYHQTRYVEAVGNPFRQSFGQLGHTFRNIRKEKHIFLFLVAFFLFIDGVYTIIDMAVAYGTAVGLDTTGLLLALLLTQFVAFPFAILFGRLASKYDTGLLIKVCIIAYTGITIFAVFLAAQWQFWVLAIMVGMFQGGVQALSRSYFGKIIPPEKSGEYFGLFDICGKGAAFMGTTLISVVTQLSGSQSLGVGALVIVFVAGYLVFRVADRECVAVLKNRK